MKQDRFNVNPNWAGTAQGLALRADAFPTPDFITSPILFNGGCLLRKHLKVEGRGTLERLHFLTVGRILRGNQLTYLRREKSFLVKGEDEYGLRVFPFSGEGRINHRKLEVIDWGKELSPSEKAESSLTFIIGEYSSGDAVKLGEVTEGQMNGVYRSLQTEMTNFLLEDWRV